MDPEKLISGLTNEIHPVFRKIYHCEFAMECSQRISNLLFRPGLKMLQVKVPKIASPAPSDNFYVRTIMQLATRLITSEAALQFFSGLMECGRGGLKFHANPRKPLGAERKQATLDRLLHFAPRVALRFREFSHLEFSHLRNGKAKEKLLGYMQVQFLPSPLAHIVMNVDQITGYDSSAASYDQHTLNVLRCSIIRGAATLCHKFAHAIAFLETRSHREPIFNNEPYAEVGHAFERYVLGGTLNDSRSAGLWLHQWPPEGRMTGYQSSVFREPIYASNASNASLMPGAQWVDHKLYGRLLNDHFWDTKTVGSDNRRCQPFKKTWLRSYHEAITTAQQSKYYITGYEEVPRWGNQVKRRRLVGTWGECPRWKDTRQPMRSTIEKSHRVQWHRRKEKIEERKDEFHERELLKAKDFAEKLDAVTAMIERF